MWILTIGPPGLSNGPSLPAGADIYNNVATACPKHVASVRSHPRVHQSCLSRLLKHVLKPLKQSKTKQYKSNSHRGVSTASGPTAAHGTVCHLPSSSPERRVHEATPWLLQTNCLKIHWKSTQDTTDYKSHLYLQNPPSWHGELINCTEVLIF